MLIWLTIFWICFALLFFCYFGYGLLLLIINLFKRLFSPIKRSVQTGEAVHVSLIVASYNEADVLDIKIRNSLAVKYPPHLLNLIFVVDGSTDSSVEIVKKYSTVKLITLPERKGKLAAIKAAVNEVKTPVIVFSDANTMLNEDCVEKIVRHYKNPKVGGVAGEKKIRSTSINSAIGDAEGFYWQYESFMKKLDADLNTVIGAAGELFSIRTHLFKNIPDKLILDDFFISMNVCLQGYKLEYEPGAYATETPSLSLADEEKRKVRISAGAYQSIGYLKKALNLFKHPLLSFQYIFRRLFRWILCPALIVGVFISNLGIVIINSSVHFYIFFLFLQLCFYLLALVGWMLIKKGKNAWMLTIPFYFVFMNYCLVKGFFIFIRGKQTVLWGKSVREPVQAAT